MEASTSSVGSGAAEGMGADTTQVCSFSCALTCLLTVLNGHDAHDLPLRCLPRHPDMPLRVYTCYRRVCLRAQTCILPTLTCLCPCPRHPPSQHRRAQSRRLRWTSPTPRPCSSWCPPAIWCWRWR